MEKSNPIARVDFNEAKILADLGSIVQDLTSTMEICERLIKLLKADSKNVILIESLWTTALIKYARCFNSGKRFGLDESIFDGFQGNPRGVHRFYINLRNKHIAHSVNPFEQVQVGLVLSSEDDEEKKIIGVATFSTKLITLQHDSVFQLGCLAKIIRDKVSLLAKQYEEKTRERGEKIPTTELYKFSRIKITIPGSEQSDKPRV